MKQVLWIGICVLAGLPLWASKAMVANCREGQGCSFEITEVSEQELAIVLGDDQLYEEAETQDIIVMGIRRDGSEVVYRERDKNRSRIDRDWGGDGYTMIYPFNPYWQPLNGDWKAVFGTVTGSSCYVDILSILKRLQGNIHNGQIVFQRPFSPTQLFPSGDMKWQRLSPTRYIGRLDFGQGASGPMQLLYHVHLINEERIETWHDVQIRIPTKGTCTAKIPITFTCTRPESGSQHNAEEIDPFAERKRPRVDRIQEAPPTPVDRLEDPPATQVPRLEDPPKPAIERL